MEYAREELLKWFLSPKLFKKILVVNQHMIRLTYGIRLRYM